MVGLSATRPLTAVWPTLVNVPPTKSRPPDSTTDVAAEFIAGGAQPATSLPVVRSSSATFSVTPLTVPSAPATYTVVPGPAAIALTAPVTVGAKPGSIAPVFASKANRWRRLTALVLPCGATEVNEPPTTIRLPTCPRARTAPSFTSGVYAAGTALGTVSCAACTARAGAGDVDGGGGGEADGDGDRGRPVTNRPDDGTPITGMHV